jgi:predicted nucleotidyltransferase
VVVSETRACEVETILRAAEEWAASRGDVVALALVGSCARGAAREDSDVDLVVLTNHPAAYTQHDEWVTGLAPDSTLVRTGDWGAVTERRLLLPSGLEVEVGFALPAWASVDPLDPGTRRVARDGLRPLHDPSGVLAALSAASQEPQPS